MPTLNEQLFTFSMMVIAVAPDAIKYAMAALGSCDDPVISRDDRASATSTSSVVISGPAQELAELHTLGARGRHAESFGRVTSPQILIASDGNAWSKSRRSTIGFIKSIGSQPGCMRSKQIATSAPLRSAQ
jgi:hypothetical protein